MPADHAPAPTAELKAERLACQRGRQRVFSGLSFVLRAGDGCWLRGPNGAGKSSLLRLLAGLGAPAAGQVTFGGHPTHRLPPGLRRQLRYVGHLDALKPELTVRDALATLVSLQGGAWSPGEIGTPPCTITAGKIGQALDQMGLAGLAQARVGTLSQGQRRRAAMARLWLAPGACTWLLDEPIDALDDDGARRVAEWATLHLANGGAVMLASHVPLPGLELPALHLREPAREALP